MESDLDSRVSSVKGNSHGRLRVLGIDPSSSICGVALIDNGTLMWTECWKKTKSKSDAWNLTDYFYWLQGIVATANANMACVEFLSVNQNAQTVRKISHYQAISVVVPKISGLMVIEARVSSARKEALGNGGLSKEAAWRIVKEMFPKHRFRRAGSGGYDEADAAILAVAGPGIAEGA